MTAVRLYVKRPMSVEVIQWDGSQETFRELMRLGWTDCGIASITGIGSAHAKVNIRTLEGTMTAEVGDYIIRGVKGEIHPCKPDVFLMTYEEVAMKEDEA